MSSWICCSCTVLRGWVILTQIESGWSSVDRYSPARELAATVLGMCTLALRAPRPPGALIGEKHSYLAHILITTRVQHLPGVDCKPGHEKSARARSNIFSKNTEWPAGEIRRSKDQRVVRRQTAGLQHDNQERVNWHQQGHVNTSNLRVEQEFNSTRLTWSSCRANSTYRVSTEFNSTCRQH